MTAGAAPGRTRPGLRVLDEALRLLDALQAEHPTADGAADQPVASGPSGPSHQGDACRLCPLCRGLAALREANPEALTRMGRALGDLAAALGELAGGFAEDPHGTPPAEPARPCPVRVQRIDVSD